MSKYTPEHIKFLMQELSCFDSADVESDDFDVAVENEQGVEGFATCSIVRLAESAFLYMDQLEQQRDGLIQQLKQTSDSLNDKIVTMQAAVIDAKQNGPEAGMQWITNTLWGPGLIPVDSEPWVNNAQHYYSHNCSSPLGPCGVCGAPSSVSGAGHVACCMEHHKQLKGGAV